MTIMCIDCGYSLEIPFDALLGEIVGCSECGLDYAVVKDESGVITLQELVIEGEDWGE